ncbi:protein patched homolog 1 isoform X2 [Lingula anatina]|uniref:Protein patched homolog 1 isoform X2 n=1 Tax=Lingula anatina TaxID=7574 RepID=A0A1S3IL10_LINAN|nr:protein patched homolog 1 isoform X2 [Lingula anatina]|eukprot:XP_013398571.1 protein patched homolog 1 isoform X2 [Lingula anatina]
MEGWSHPAFRPSEGTTMTVPTRREAFTPEDSELCTRTSWVDAKTAYKEIKKGKASGNTCALWLRWHLQKQLFNLGCFIERHCGKVLFVGLLLLCLCCIGLKTATIETNVEKLWVEEGGRLDQEIAYTQKHLGEGSGITNEIVIQTPKSGKNILSKDSLLLHLRTVLAATQITVDMYDITWRFSDLCNKPSFPSFEDSLVDQMLEPLTPCVIISPLDCFWEGAKLLGPDHAVNAGSSFQFGGLKWTNLNPEHLLSQLRSMGNIFPVQAIEDFLARAGITTGYVRKSCLDPTDPECPFTAPNKLSQQEPDIGSELTGGCDGFATKYMHWEEDLIVGGVHKNRSGHIVRAEAIQSIVQLMAEKQMFEYYEDSYKVTSIDFTREKARAILEAWQRKFTQVVQEMGNGTQEDNLHGFSSTSLLDMLKEFSEVSYVRVALGYIFMLVYAIISLMRWTDFVQSQSGIGMAGVLLVALSVAAGLGICSVLGIRFNASTTQIIPFLALGLGVDDMFLLAHTFAENAKNKEISSKEQTGECLKRTGVTVLLTSITNASAFFMAAIIPIPALRAFVLQAAILVIFNCASILLVFPAIVSVDLIRKEENRADVFCCFPGTSTTDVVELAPRERHTEHVAPPVYREPSPPPSYQTITHTSAGGDHAITVLGPPQSDSPVSRQVSLSSVGPPSASSSRQCLTPDEGPTCREHCAQTQQECCHFSLTRLAKSKYGPMLETTPAKILVGVLFIALLVFGVWGIVKVKDGLDLTDIVPRDTNEWKFLDAQGKYFGFYNMYIVTKDSINYPNQQKMMFALHKEFLKINKVIKKEDGTLPDFWLELFRQWLLDLQLAFDQDWSSGCITTDGWFANSTEEGRLGYLLLIQTGDVDDPYRKEQAATSRLVNDQGIINPQAFYNYLTAWVTNDALAYDASMAEIKPEPQHWVYDPSDQMELRIPKAQAILYSQMPFYLNNMVDNQDVIATIEEIRKICDSYTNNGLAVYPSGIPFTFWEQYLHLRFYLLLALICVLGVTFLVITLVLMNPWAGFMVVMVLAMIVVELFGFMGLIGIKLSAIPAVILIVSVGIGVEFTVHICVGFITAIGSRNRRMRIALEHMFAPVIHGAISTLLGVAMLVGSEFDFIVRYFFNVLTALVVLGVLNGLILLPVLLSIFGPKGEVQPKDNPDRLSTPTPEATPPPQRPPRALSRRVYPRMPSDISLTTISEEPTQYSSHEIIVSPEVVVETTIGADSGTPASCSSTSSSSSNKNNTSSLPQSSQGIRHVTTVRTKATVKVEVHHPVPGTVDQEHSYKSKRRKLKELEGSDSDSSNKS